MLSAMMTIESGTKGYQQKVRWLEQTLELVNGLPGGVSQYCQIAVNRFGQVLEDDAISENTRAFLNAVGPFLPGLQSPAERFQFLVDFRTTLKQMAFGQTLEARGIRYRLVTKAEVVLRTDNNGFITAEPPVLFQLMDGIRADRIRHCQVCGKLFYAERKLSKGCRGRCASTLRKRRQREPMTDEQLKERAKEHKREQRKAQKALREAKETKEQR